MDEDTTELSLFESTVKRIYEKYGNILNAETASLCTSLADSGKKVENILLNSSIKASGYKIRCKGDNAAYSGDEIKTWAFKDASDCMINLF